MARLTHNEKVSLGTIALHPKGTDVQRVLEEKSRLGLSPKTVKIIEALVALSTKNVEGIDKRTLKTARKLASWAKRLPLS